ncbi:purine biosynthesis protein PurH [Mobilitalea sibirica]|uniref:Purine biosynthesis protein PurH n=1 Tax=Mobilitalea sibirica TaxID=1462919 RepID=A0A8J7H4Q6_9FIRM|nr:antitoxin VbhA family protein [Mobilitalea sibirica]MBH1942538.1 purine biosynthesis protein PurH [Mobilitalea sibirica]
MKSYLIKDTTKEERKKLVEDALTISQIDAGYPTEETIKLFDMYINGELEIDEINKMIIESISK